MCASSRSGWERLPRAHSILHVVHWQSQHRPAALHNEAPVWSLMRKLHTCPCIETHPSRCDLQAEAARLDAVRKEMHVLKGQQVKQGQELFTLRNAEKEMISEIAGGQAQHKNVAERIRKLDEKVRATHLPIWWGHWKQRRPLGSAADGRSCVGGP